MPGMTATLETLAMPFAASDLRQLESLLRDCVRAGASIGFLAGITEEEAQAYWAKVAADAAAGAKLVLVARDASRAIIGSAQLALESRANGRHRAEVQKVMVRPACRRQGLARRLMAELEAQAQARGVWLLFLDTSDSHAGARQLYEALAYTYVGGIPDYATNPQGEPEQNAIFYKRLPRAAAG